MFERFYVNGSVNKNSLPLTGIVATGEELHQGDVVDFDPVTLEIEYGADIDAVKVARYVISEADDGKYQDDSYVEALYTFTAGKHVRIFDMKSLEGHDAITISSDAVTGTIVAGSVLVPVFDGGWALETVVTGYAFYLKVNKVVEYERGNSYICELVAAYICEPVVEEGV